MASENGQFEYDLRLIGNDGHRMRLLQRRLDQDLADTRLIRFELKIVPPPEHHATSSAKIEPYLALSYVWGSSTDRDTIQVNGSAFRVSINLYRALAHLGRAEPERTMPIWIDAICINQKDDEEKGLQVARMREIYRNAMRTIIWLGEGTEASDLVMTHLNRIGKEAFEAGVLELNAADIKVWPRLAPGKAKIKTSLEGLMPRMTQGHEDKVSFPLDDLIDLSYREWFRRVWVVQELAVAKECAFVCGEKSVPGAYFIAGFMFSILWITHELGPIQRAGSLLEICIAICRSWWRNSLSCLQTVVKRQAEQRPIIPSPLAATTLGTRKKFQEQPGLSLKRQLVRAFTLTVDGGLEATDPRDRIYALLGIANDADDLNIRTQYDETTGYRDFYAATARLLVGQGHVDILSLCRPCYCAKKDLELPHRDLALPSWTPDWTHPILTPWGRYIENGLFHASGDTTVAERAKGNPQPDDPKVLDIAALFVGTVSEIGFEWKPRWKEDFNHRAAKVLFTEIEGFVKKSTKYNDHESHEAVWRIPIGDKETNPVGQVQRATKESYKQYLSLRALSFDKTEEWDNVGMGFANSYMPMMKDMHNCRPFISDHGYVGLCPNLSVLGDEIFIPLGSHVPFVFRKVQDGLYKLVGEVYIQGLMDGAILKLSVPTRTLQLI